MFRARHRVIGREVAIKILHASYSRDAVAIGRFEAEARALSKISHPGIVNVFEFGELGDGRRFLVMELVVGKTLREILRVEGHLEPERALPILRQIAAAIDAAHAVGIAHRDLKPENVFLGSDGTIRLIDFGLAKLFGEDSSVTQTGAVFGTPLYMSPEQCRGHASDLRTDCYSFGALAYHVLTGSPPFSGEPLELALHHCNDDPEAPSKKRPGLSSRIDDVVLALLAKEPEARPSPIEPVLDALERNLPLPVHPRRPRRRRIGAFAAIAAIALAGGTVIWWRTRRAPDAVAAAPDACAPGASKVAGLWDAPTRTAIHDHLATVPGPDAGFVWSVVDREVGAFARDWTIAWDSACRSSDKLRDPLLYAQRTTCLEGVLGDVQARVRGLTTVDPVAFMRNWSGFEVAPNTLAGCASEGVLRAQGPLPPPERRAEVTALLARLDAMESDRRAAVDFGVYGPDVDSLATRYRKLQAKLQEVHPPAAPAAAFRRARLYYSAARTDPGFVQSAVEAADETIRLAEAVRADQTFANALLLRLDLEVARASFDQAAFDALAQRAQTAIERAGNAPFAKARLDQLRGRFARQAGKLEEAEPLLRRAIPGFEGAVPVVDDDNPRHDLINFLIAAGRPDEAVEQARMVVNRMEPLEGPTWHGEDAPIQLAVTLMRIGNVADAETVARESLERSSRFARPPWNASNDLEDRYMLALELAIRSGRSTEFAFTALGRQAATWDRLASNARGAGRPELVRFAVEKQLLSDARRPEYVNWLAYVGGRGNGPLELGPGEEEGQQAEALAHHERWKEVLPLAEKLRATRTYPNPVRLSGGDSVLGRARLGVGDLAGARLPLEQSLALMDDYVDFHFWVPATQLALARVLWETGGDRARARYLAGRARDGFVRFAHDNGEREAEAWLRDHPVAPVAPSRTR